MKTIYFVITNGGDGSNGIHWTLERAVLDKMEDLANDGDETYASGDGLQVTELRFPDDFDLYSWCVANHIRLTTSEDMEREW
jgi:hypothetical protein